MCLVAMFLFSLYITRLQFDVSVWLMLMRRIMFATHLAVLWMLSNSMFNQLTSNNGAATSGQTCECSCFTVQESLSSLPVMSLEPGAWSLESWSQTLFLPTNFQSPIVFVSNRDFVWRTLPKGMIYGAVEFVIDSSPRFQLTLAPDTHGQQDVLFFLIHVASRFFKCCQEDSASECTPSFRTVLLTVTCF